ncbi:MAG: single-stranded-DNA-specific exonuclease RecJ [Stagnimonas sp.]|nr:single-stranded-DNA-specific exonuclease RecJ [Stagnimonas sp.]
MAAAPRVVRRPAGDPDSLPATLHPVLRRIYAARGVQAGELALELKQLLPPDGLKGLPQAAELLADAIAAGRRIVIAGDYDADGATGCALGVLGLRALGASAVDYVVPDRFRMGYGLSPELVDVAVAAGAQLLVTVDNGIASLAGVRHAREQGLSVIVTDHHLPGAELPAADAIVNPNQPGCTFASKALAGVGVMFYLLLGLRAELRRRGMLAVEPNLAQWLDLVALGTVADVARLDANNRVLVEQGLRRLRAGRARPGLLALLEVAGRPPAHLGAGDLGFVLGPRLNAAGRLDDMRAGIDCLLADSIEAARPLARELDRLNRERRTLTGQMADEAGFLLEDSTAIGVCVFEPGWHEGIVGLVASRLKERLHRPVIAFARGQEPGLLKGSARSIAGLNVRDALAAVDARHPGLIPRFGGHAMAAGLNLAEVDYPRFAAAFDAVCAECLSPAELEQRIDSDGPLAARELGLDTARQLELAGPWGAGFPEPQFSGEFQVASLKLMGSEQQHVRYRLLGEGAELEAVDFGGGERARAPGCRVLAVYQLGVNRWNGRESVQLLIRHLEDV